MSMPEPGFTYLVVTSAGEIHDAFDTKSNAETFAKKLCMDTGSTVYVSRVSSIYNRQSVLKVQDLT